ncbi:MAG: class I SAM-dependent methyltransferase [Candidatus Wildermuthbacteria bacterium]|nr:class I SAM-dependent methyltransferase [Candidatus Wildermuthbacteria bacterium]
MEYTSKLYAFLQPADPTYFGRVRRYLDPQPTEKILEIGCGRGYTTKKVQRIAPQTFGIDLNEKAIQNGVAQNLRAMNAEALEFVDNTFDKIYSFHTIEHIPNIAKALGEMARVVKPGGRILLVYPAEPIRGMFSMFAAAVLLRNPFRSREIHLHKLSPAIIQQLVLGLGLEHVQSSFSLLWLPEFRTILQKKK